MLREKHLLPYFTVTASGYITYKWYDTSDAAAIDFGKAHLAQSLNEQIEYGSTIFLNTTTGKFRLNSDFDTSTTNPFYISIRRSGTDLNEERYAEIHTHWATAEQGGVATFSDVDARSIIAAQTEGVAMKAYYLVNPYGEITVVISDQNGQYQSGTNLFGNKYMKTLNQSDVLLIQGVNMKKIINKSHVIGFVTALVFIVCVNLFFNIVFIQKGVVISKEAARAIGAAILKDQYDIEEVIYSRSVNALTGEERIYPFGEIRYIINEGWFTWRIYTMIIPYEPGGSVWDYVGYRIKIGKYSGKIYEIGTGDYWDINDEHIITIPRPEGFEPTITN